MHGNVWEWVQDTWHTNYEGAPTDGSAWEGGGSFRVFRGGGWRYGAESCSAASRYHGAPGAHVNYIGFRLLRSA